jgi:hypothetical protein
VSADFLEGLDEELEDEENWDPALQERQYHRSRQTGERGYMVRRKGTDFIRLDRPQQEILRPFRESEWIPDVEHRPFTKAQVAQVCFEADRKLCFFLGLHDKAKKEWLSLSDEHRIGWMKRGPLTPPIRHEQWRAIMTALEPLTR